MDHTEQIISVNDLVKNSLNDIKEKIEVYYVGNNKVSNEDGNLMYMDLKRHVCWGCSPQLIFLC